jgi:septal ring factor EnvC (AmiA/AmiB activator)
LAVDIRAARSTGRRRPAALATVLILALLATACSANRQVVRLQTRMQVMNDVMEQRQEKMERDMALMSQLLEQNVAKAEAAEKELQRARQKMAARARRRPAARLAQDLRHVRRSLADVQASLAQAEKDLGALRARQQRYPEAEPEPEAPADPPAR